jgi:signal transduction histidine kinase
MGRVDLDNPTTSNAAADAASHAASAHAATLARALANATTPDQAVRAAIRFCTDGFKVHAAVWVRGNEGEPMRLVGAWGLGGASRTRVEQAIPLVPSSPAPLAIRSVVRSFARLSGAADVGVVEAGLALLVVGDVPATCRPMLDAAAGLLGDALDRIAWEERQQLRLDLGLAVTAHELRGPLLGARVALEHLMRSDADLSDDLGLIRQTERELAQLSKRVESLLRWSNGAPRLRKVRTDLARLVREVIGTCTLEHGRHRIVLRAPNPVPARIDPGYFRGALGNVVHNALIYSPASEPVDVRVYSTKARRPTVTVRDRGPGILPSEAAHLFEPFARGTAVRGHGNRRVEGAGLGLFVAKRVIDAHGGDISFRASSDGCGTVCRIRLQEVAIA